MDHALDSGIRGVCVSRMSKKYKDRVCAYCAESESETADHVIARAFFPEQYRGGLPKAPACEQCQGEKSRLENVFIAVLPFGSEHPLAVATLKEKGRRRLYKNAALRKKLEAGLAPLLVEHKGLVLPSVSLPVEGEQFIRCGHSLPEALSGTNGSTLYPMGIAWRFSPSWIAAWIFFANFCTWDRNTAG
jgi:hypothetical protein